MAASDAVDQASRLDEIGFPEFTAKLITDTFDALVSANIRQTESYLDLVQSVGKSLATFITETRDDISGDELLQFLATALPPESASSQLPTKAVLNAELDSDDALALNTALATSDDANIASNNQVATAGTLDQSAMNTLLTAVANRISQNRYELLQEMVRQGILRLVVEDGTIETRLTFTTYGSSFYQRNTSSYHRDQFSFRAGAKTGSFVSLWARASASTRYSSVNVRTAKESNRDVSGSRVQIYGRVNIRFKTDYLPLATAGEG